MYWDFYIDLPQPNIPIPPWANNLYTNGILEITKGSRDYMIEFEGRPYGLQAIDLPDNLEFSSGLETVTIYRLKSYTVFCDKKVYLQGMGGNITRPLEDMEKPVTIEVK